MRVFSRTHDILFNASKTKYMVFKRREIVHVNVAPLYFDGLPINCVHECDLLGITNLLCYYLPWYATNSLLIH